MLFYLTWAPILDNYGASSCYGALFLGPQVLSHCILKQILNSACAVASRFNWISLTADPSGCNWAWSWFKNGPWGPRVLIIIPPFTHIFLGYLGWNNTQLLNLLNSCAFMRLSIQPLRSTIQVHPLFPENTYIERNRGKQNMGLLKRTCSLSTRKTQFLARRSSQSFVGLHLEERQGWRFHRFKQTHSAEGRELLKGYKLQTWLCQFIASSILVDAHESFSLFWTPLFHLFQYPKPCPLCSQPVFFSAEGFSSFEDWPCVTPKRIARCGASPPLRGQDGGGWKRCTVQSQTFAKKHRWFA